MVPQQSHRCCLDSCFSATHVGCLLQRQWLKGNCSLCPEIRRQKDKLRSQGCFGSRTILLLSGASDGVLHTAAMLAHAQGHSPFACCISTVPKTDSVPALQCQNKKKASHCINSAAKIQHPTTRGRHTLMPTAGHINVPCK